MVYTPWVTAAFLAGAAVAQYFPPTPEGVKVVESKHQKGVKVSYKEVSFGFFFLVLFFLTRSCLPFVA